MERLCGYCEYHFKCSKSKKMIVSDKQCRTGEQCKEWAQKNKVYDKRK